MLNLNDDISRFVESQITLYSTIQQNVFQGNSSEEIMIRADPSPKMEVEYLDERAQSSLTFAFYTKSADQMTALTALESITRLLNMGPGFALTDARLVKCEAVTMPILHQITEAKEYVFTASFNIIFEDN